MFQWGKMEKQSAMYRWSRTKQYGEEKLFQLIFRCIDGGKCGRMSGFTDGARRAENPYVWMKNNEAVGQPQPSNDF